MQQHAVDDVVVVDHRAAGSDPGVHQDEHDEPPSCPDEAAPLQGRMRLPDVGPVAELGQESAVLGQTRDDRDGGWNGPVAIERSDRCWNGPVAIERSDGPHTAPATLDGATHLGRYRKRFGMHLGGCPALFASCNAGH